MMEMVIKDLKMNKVLSTTRGKILGFKWLFKHSTTHQVRCNWTGK